MSAITDLFPRTRAEVIRLLFTGGNQEIHLRDIARLAGMSPAALQKELTYLTHKEFVLNRRDGNRLYYRANPAHPLFPELCGIAMKTTGITVELNKALSAVEGIDLAWIFGSVAAQTATSQSDVDLIVLGSVGLRKLTPFLRGVAQKLGREINPVCMTLAEWHKKMLSGDVFVTRLSDEPKLWLKGGADELAAMV